MLAVTRTCSSLLVAALASLPAVARAEGDGAKGEGGPGSEAQQSAEAAPAPAVGAAHPQHRLANDDPTFLAVEVAGSAAVAVTLILAGGSAPTECRWCGTNSLDVSVRNAIYLDDSKAAGVASHVVSLGAAPLLALGAVVLPALGSEHPSYAIADSVKILNAFLLTEGFAEFAKHVSARERPAFYFGREGETEFASVPTDRYKSFFSGDTAWAFAITASSATVAYERGYWTAPYAAVGGAVLGVATGTLRMAADVHWLTDVLTGAAVGTGVGIAMPLLLHPRKDTDAPQVTVVPVMTGGLAGVMASGSF
jgi:membrane-associated phospholipid phosphatase